LDDTCAGHQQFVGGHDQGDHDHFGELLIQAIERLDVEQVSPHRGGFLLARIDVGDHQLVDPIAKDQQRNADQ